MSQLATSSDHLLKNAIEKELAWAPDVTADHIGVGVLDGTVTLSGQVTTYPEKKAAVAAVLRVRGVTGVADEIVVQHHYGRLEDSDIAREATTALRASVVVPDSVKATVQDHHVRLVGTVPWHYQRETAAKVVGALPGVVAVLNDITVAPKVTLSASQAEQQIRAALVRNAQVDSRTIHVKASGSTIELTGTVQSWAEYRQASHAAWATPGVTHVRNHISVIS